MNTYYAILFVMGVLFSSSCTSVKHITITCNPSTAEIYVDDVYQGNGFVKYDIPKGQKYIQISCSDDGVNYASRRFYVRSIDSIIDFQLKEMLRYSSGNPNF